MANNPYSTSQQAASIGGITPGDIGVAANNFVRKKDLTATGKFDPSPLASYSDNYFVLASDVKRGTFRISLAMNSDVTSRGTVQINSGAAGASATAEVSIGDQITARCNLTQSGDVFDGWYNGATRVSTSASYTFTASQPVSLVARIFYLTVTPTSLDFDPTGGSKTFQITTNTTWRIS